MGKTELAPGPLPDGFEPMSDKHIAKNRRVAVAIGENNVRRYTWKRASEEQNARGWASSITMTMESMVEHNDADMVSGFVNVAAVVLTYALDSLRFERARAEATEQRAKAAERELAQARADRDKAAAAAGAAAAIAKTAQAAAARMRAEAAQARDDRALMTGLWLGAVHHDVLPALLPTDQGDRDRLAAALDAVDLQASEASHVATGRAVIARIVAEMGGGAA